MARENKGQQVKSFKDRIPQPDQSFADEVTKVYFKVTDGRFVIYLPEHISRVVHGCEGLELGGGLKGDARVQSTTIDDVLECWEGIKTSYMRTIRLEGAVKVIRYDVRYNDGDRFARFNAPHKIDDAPTPAVALSYEVLWRSEGRLFRGHYSGEDLILDFEGMAMPSAQFDSKRVIEWTEEREAFFKAVQGGLLRLIAQLVDFMGENIETNIAALASGERTLALAAPNDG